MITITADGIKQKLKRLQKTPDFQVYFTDKKNKRIDGLYFPERNEIHINNGNFSDDNEMMITAIHEFSHHVQNTIHFLKSNPHDKQFWYIFHNLLYRAEEIGVYENTFISQNNEGFKELVEETIKFNESVTAFFEKVSELKEYAGKDKRDQFDDAAVRYLKFDRKDILKICSSDNLHAGYNLQYSSRMKLSRKKKIKNNDLVLIEYALDGSRREDSISIDQFNYLTQKDETPNEIDYWSEKKTKEETALQNKQSKISMIAAKIKNLLSGGSGDE